MVNKLSKKEINAVLSRYNLGKLKDIRYHEGGMISYIFEFKTDKGNFIVRKLGYQFNWYHRTQHKMEFTVLEHLHGKDFPYETPMFLKNKNGNYVSRINGILFEVYEKLEGEHIEKLDEGNVKEVAKALAIYHKYMSNYKPDKGTFKVRRYNWMLDRYCKMRKIEEKGELNMRVLENVDFFENLLKRLLRKDLGIDMLVIHSDFSPDNFLFRDNKLTGILDFENLSLYAKAYDVAYVLRRKFGLKDIFLKEYRNHMRFSKEEEKNLVSFILLNLCNHFWWTYLGMKKRPDLKLRSMKKTIKQVNEFYKMWK